MHGFDLGDHDGSALQRKQKDGLKNKRVKGTLVLPFKEDNWKLLQITFSFLLLARFESHGHTYRRG